jgi:hypothetical protein
MASGGSGCRGGWGQQLVGPPCCSSAQGGDRVGSRRGAGRWPCGRACFAAGPAARLLGLHGQEHTYDPWRRRHPGASPPRGPGSGCPCRPRRGRHTLPRWWRTWCLPGAAGGDSGWWAGRGPRRGGGGKAPAGLPCWAGHASWPWRWTCLRRGPPRRSHQGQTEVPAHVATGQWGGSGGGGGHEGVGGGAAAGRGRCEVLQGVEWGTAAALLPVRQSTTRGGRERAASATELAMPAELHVGNVWDGARSWPSDCMEGRSYGGALAWKGAFDISTHLGNVIAHALQRVVVFIVRG